MPSEIFDPESLERLCRHDLPAALRLLADHLEQREISGTLWSFQGNGMLQDWRRDHFLMTLDLAVSSFKSDAPRPGPGAPG